MSKKILLIPVVMVLLLIFSVAAGFVWYQNMVGPVSTDKVTKQFIIIRGSSATQIANKLEQQGLIKSALAFRLYSKLNNLDLKIPPGEFDLSPNLDVAGIIKKFIAGPTQVWVTIPEGLRREQLPARFADSLEMKPTQQITFSSQFLQQTQDLEGYLYPDTYLFPKDATPGAVIKKLTQTFDAKVTPDLRQKIVQQGRTLGDIVTLASILERETNDVSKEGNTVAGILLKRIASGWPIQADATTQYAIGKEDAWWPTPTRADLEINSAFNTYKNLGLPPHPIASPGIEAISAAINPVDSPYWYYIHDSSGEIHYAKTLEEHNQNIEQYLK